MTDAPGAAGERRGLGHLLRLGASAGYFGLLLASYYMVRPLRDAFGAGSGPTTIKYLATAVFVAMLAIVPVFGWLVARVPRRRLLPATYAFFALHLLAFAAVLALDPESRWAGRVFYVWATVFNLFVVSVFWSFMADIWSEPEGRRFFGVVAAGGSLGGLLGPWLTRSLAGTLGTPGICVVAAGLLLATLPCILWLGRGTAAGAGQGRARLDEPVGGEILTGLTGLFRSPFLGGIAAMVAIGSLLGMVVYIEMARVAATAFATSAARTAFFAQRDLWVNGASFVLQLLVGLVTGTLGVRASLTGSALCALTGFLALAVSPVAGVLIALNVGLRVLEFGIGKPSRDMLYTVVDPEARYKVKNVIDTVVYRGCDMASSWAHDVLVAFGATLGMLAGGAAIVAAGAAGLAFAVGTGYRRRGGR